ncbi:pilus assembly protein [Psychrobacter maritimus]|uniref:hypothetical protein n=1 Tax=Psychrobacter maritimus TaxID=256325 RepID=UPI00191A7E20|nr:hypothetical protein [Psychrobacter maritimus]
MKISKLANNDKAHATMKHWSLKVLSTAVLAFMASSAGHTTDLEIYQGATYGNASIIMMLDNSGSMDPRSISEDYTGKGLNVVKATDGNYYCNYDGRYVSNVVSTEDITQRMYDDSNNAISGNAGNKVYTVSYCTVNNKKYYDRMSRLKMALIPLFANPKSIGGFGPDVDISKYNIGIGNFFYRNGDKGGGKIDSPIISLTLENRKKLINNIIDLRPSTNTPIANAYAEAGAYMLGNRAYALSSKTEEYNNLVGYSTQDRNGRYNLYKCTTNSTSTSNIGNYKYFGCNNYTNLQSGERNLRLNLLGGITGDYYSNGATYYFNTLTRVVEDDLWDGFALSTIDSKNTTSYISPVSSEPNQCDGYGVYFLTDGEPNNSYEPEITLDLMNTSLTGGSVTMGDSCNSGLTSTGTTFGSSGNNKPAWECIGEFSKALKAANNAKGKPIATATVGFGNVYKQIADQGKVSKSVTRPGRATETVQVYQCNHPSITSQDAKNLCNLGEKGSGYGEGGFYYTEESTDIAKSVKQFIEDVSKADIDPISAGTMAVPLDSLGGLRSRQFAYLPILEPIPKSPLLWNGNLKKYKVKNSTIIGGNDNFVFSDSTGLFATNTYDLWNTIDDPSRSDALRPDGAAPQIGGAYQQVFENGTTPNAGSRNLFVDSGNSLTNLKVGTDKKPENFNNLTGYTNSQKLKLLSFMGYSEPTTTTVTDGQALTATKDKGLKNIGGVLHSIPQLITKKVAVDATGKFDTSKREDYIIYGSMDGALHMLDDSTGKEVFTFVPKQIVDLQPDALSGKGSAKDGSYPYGVDAPWLTYASYTTKATTTGAGDAATTVNTYEADQSFALGGLRMGGSTYYALDVSNATTPKIIYSIGSNYSNRLMGDTTALSGIKGNVTGNTSVEQQAFAKMGQSWGKPALGYVKSGGKRVMVSLLPGGYDTCYEDANFKLNDATNSKAACKSRAEAQGNGVYMVQMGEVKTQTNKEETVDISVNNGNLLWWASNSGTSITAASTSTTASLQYSKVDDLKHSVVTQIRTLDRNYDGLIDHIYFADLGGQVWRADINNNADTKNFKVDRVVKVLDVSDQVGTGDAPPRIYERPLVTFYNDKFGYIDEANTSGSARGVQAMITVGTGDRSNPVTATRNVPDALYNIIDKDVSRSDLFYYGTGTAPTMSLRTPVNKVAGTTNRNDKLQMLTFSAADNGKAATAAVGSEPAKPATLGIKEKMQSGVIQGWYMPFNAWLNEPKQTAGPYKMKMFNEPDALAGILISSSYNPDKGQAIQTCSAGVKGATQRERTCLPYGTCLDSTGNAVLTIRSTFDAGSGIVDNIVSQFNDTSIFSSLVNRNDCEGDSCLPKVICPNGECDPVPPKCTGPTCGPLDGFNTDKRINPLSWIEH